MLTIFILGDASSMTDAHRDEMKIMKNVEEMVVDQRFSVHRGFVVCWYLFDINCRGKYCKDIVDNF